MYIFSEKKKIPKYLCNFVKHKFKLYLLFCNFKTQIFGGAKEVTVFESDIIITGFTCRTFICNNNEQCGCGMVDQPLMLFLRTVTIETYNRCFIGTQLNKL